MNVEIRAEAALFPEKEYINRIAVAVCAFKDAKQVRSRLTTNNTAWTKTTINFYPEVSLGGGGGGW
jgi:hypothetical protein